VDGELLLTLGAAPGVDLLRRVEEVVVRLGQSADVGEVCAEEETELGEDGPAKRKQPLLPALTGHADQATLRVEVAHLDAGQLASSYPEEKQAEQREPVAGMLRDREEPGPCVGWQKRRDALLGARAPDARRRRDRDVALLLGPAPEGTDDGGHLLPRSRRALAPEVDDVAQVVDGDVDRLLVGKRNAHTRQDGLVVAERRRRRPVLVAEPAQVATDELAERRRAVGLVLHRLADDAGGLPERQARAPAVRASPVTTYGGVGPCSSRGGWRVTEERELVRGELAPGLVARIGHAVRVGIARSPITANRSPHVRGYAVIRLVHALQSAPRMPAECPQIVRRPVPRSVVVALESVDCGTTNQSRRVRRGPEIASQRHK
jgi:hypothetical protein